MSILHKLNSLKRIFLNRELIIIYRKTSAVVDHAVGYLDIDTVAKRYYESTRQLSLKQLMTHSPVKDAVHFLIHNRDSLIIRKAGKILDIGCGAGAYSLIFSSSKLPFKKYTYHGCEISDKFVELGRMLYPQHKFFTSLAQNLQVKDRSYEVVFCSGTLHYTLTNWKKSISEMARVARDHIVITRLPVTKYHKSFNVEQSVMGISGKEKHYFQVFNLNELENEFIRNGLKVAARDYTSEEYPIIGVNEKIILNNYLLTHA